MDILNFISWIKGRRVVTSVDPAKTLLPVGLKDNRRDDKYLTGAISVQDLAAQIAPQPTYKVYTALLTQSGGDNVQGLSFDNNPGGPDVTIGVTYQIADNTAGLDVTNIGAPNNELGTYFVATGIRPANWGEGTLNYNTGAPVVTVLENTIGNICFTYSVEGEYLVNSDNLFTENKTAQFLNTDYTSDGYLIISNFNTNSAINLASFDSNGTSDGLFSSTPIEIRVYN